MGMSSVGYTISHSLEVQPQTAWLALSNYRRDCSARQVCDKCVTTARTQDIAGSSHHSSIFSVMQNSLGSGSSVNY